MIKAFFHKMRSIVLAHDFNLATELVIRAFHQLEFAHIFVLLDMLSQSSLPALVITLYDLKKASIIMSSYVFKYNNRLAAVVWAHSSPISAVDFMLVKFLPFQHDITTFFKDTFAFVRA